MVRIDVMVRISSSGTARSSKKFSDSTVPPGVRAEADAEVAGARDLLGSDVARVAKVPVQLTDRHSGILHFEALEVLQMRLNLGCGYQMLVIEVTEAANSTGFASTQRKRGAV
jgi:hypothetical protein